MVPISVITAAHKLFGRAKPINKDSNIIRKSSDGEDSVNAPKLIEYLRKNDAQEKGKPLTEECITSNY
jgi:hypothetical protein